MNDWILFNERLRGQNREKDGREEELEIYWKIEIEPFLILASINCISWRGSSVAMFSNVYHTNKLCEAICRAITRSKTLKSYLGEMED